MAASKYKLFKSCSQCYAELENFEEFESKLKGISLANIFVSFKCNDCAKKSEHWQQLETPINANVDNITTCIDQDKVSNPNLNPNNDEENHFLSDSDDFNDNSEIDLCKLCNYQFRTQKSAIKHFSEKHFDESSWKFDLFCRICAKGFEFSSVENRNLHELNKHTKIVNSIRVYKCKFCKFVSKNIEDIIQHRNLRHCEKWKCFDKKCRPKKRFQSYDDFKTHTIAIHLHNEKYRLHPCELCEDKFTHRERSKHLAERHQNSMGLFSCHDLNQDCSYTSKVLRYYLRHLKKYHYNKYLELPSNYKLCEFCSESFRSDFSLVRHVRMVHLEPIKGLECDICGSIIPHKTKMLRHLLTHTNLRPHQCNFCEKTYRDATDLRRHKRIHGIGEKNKNCKFCTMKFYEGKDLRKHVRTAHNTTEV